MTFHALLIIILLSGFVLDVISNLYTDDMIVAAFSVDQKYKASPDRFSRPYQLSFTSLTDAKPNEMVMPPSTETFIAIMRANYRDQNQLVGLYESYIRSTDYVMTHPNDDNWNYANELPGMKGTEFFSLDEIRDKAADLKEKGATFISYDLESTYSPSDDIANPTESVAEASKVVHQNGLQFIVAPSRSLTDRYYSSIAPFADIYILQAQAFTSDPTKFKSYVQGIVPKINAVNPGMPIIVEVSTARGTLAEMMRCFSAVSGIVDGVTIWYGNTPEDLRQVNEFLRWFDENYK
jgi:hypothetical protein